MRPERGRADAIDFARVSIFKTQPGCGRLLGDQLSGDLGLSYAEINSGERIEGVYRRHVDLASGRFAVIEKSREFTLVPRQPVLERHLGKQVSGFVRGDSISWTIGRHRSTLLVS
jgi:Protein of unknown function (DUF3363)